MRTSADRSEAAKLGWRRRRKRADDKLRAEHPTRWLARRLLGAKEEAWLQAYGAPGTWAGFQPTGAAPSSDPATRGPPA